MIFHAQNYSEFLKGELEARIANNRSYSLRAFAKHLGLSPGALSELISGKRKLSLKVVLKISNALGLNAAETKHLMNLANQEVLNFSQEAKLLKSTQITKREKTIIDLEYFKVVENWYHFAILNLSECKNFIWNISYIAKRLRLNKFEIKMAIDRLIKVGLLNYDKAQVFVPAEFVETPNDIPSSAIRNYHKQILQKAAQSVDEQHPDEREFNGLGFAMDPKYIPAIKAEMREFVDQIFEKYNNGNNKKEVYQLHLSLFRLSEKDED